MKEVQVSLEKVRVRARPRKLVRSRQQVTCALPDHLASRLGPCHIHIVIFTVTVIVIEAALTICAHLLLSLVVRIIIM